MVPTCGCSETVRAPLISVSPILEINTLYSGEFVITKNAYSTPCWQNTGLGNLNVVAVAPVKSALISDGLLTTLAKGKVFGPGTPFIVFLISNQIGKFSSLCVK